MTLQREVIRPQRGWLRRFLVWMRKPVYLPKSQARHFAPSLSAWSETPHSPS